MFIRDNYKTMLIYSLTCMYSAEKKFEFIGTIHRLRRKAAKRSSYCQSDFSLFEKIIFSITNTYFFKTDITSMSKILIIKLNITLIIFIVIITLGQNFS